MEKRKTPDIRFKGFTDAWKQRKLGDIAGVIMGQSPDSANYTDNPNDYILVQGNADMRDGLVVPRVWTTQITKQAEVGDLIISVRAPVGDIGKTGYNVVLGRGVAAIKGNEFVFQQLGYMKASGYWIRYSTGSTFDSINSNELKNAQLIMPDTAEQIQIGSFLQEIDQLITLHQRKLEKLKKLKKSLLQRMFPENGCAKPELRFAGFTDVWKQRKLFDYIDSIIDFRGRTPKKLGMIWSNSGYLALSALNVKNGYIDFTQESHYGDQKLYDKWMAGKELHKGQVLFTTEAPVGNIAQIPDENRYILSQRTIAFVVNKDRITDDFLATVLRTNSVYTNLLSLSSGGTAKGVSQKTLSEISIVCPPNLNEQKCLANYFSAFDHLITLHQRELETLKRVKKALLDKMFV